MKLKLDDSIFRLLFKKMSQDIFLNPGGMTFGLIPVHAPAIAGNPPNTADPGARGPFSRRASRLRGKHTGLIFMARESSSNGDSLKEVLDGKAGESGGEPAGLSDATRREDILKSFKYVYDRIAEGIIFHDSQGRILAANPYICDLLEYSEEELIGQDTAVLVPKENIQEYLDSYQPHTLPEGQEFRVERPLLKKNGGSVIFEVYVKRLNENLSVSMHRDITKRKRNELQKQDAQSIVCHDLKSLSNNIVNLSREITDDANLTGKQREILDLIVRSGRDMSNIIDNHIRILQIEHNGYEVKSRALDIREFVNCSLKNFASIIAAKNLVIDYGRKDQMAFVFADEALCSSMFNNLLLNAIEASPAPGGHIAIEIKRENGTVLISIQNQGAVPKEIRAFFGQKYITTKTTGTGLGVYNARLMAEIQGGSLGWRTDENSTTVEIKLPAAK